MTDEKAGQAQDTVSFGPFRLLAGERLLEKSGSPLNLGARALDILIVLVEHASEVVRKKDLIARVWPDVAVDEGNLRFHIAALRKALGDGQSGARYVTTVPGRGYCFVAPVSRSSPRRRPEQDGLAAEPAHRLPASLKRMVGRDDAVQTITEQLAAERFLTVVGPGGIGKTTVALAVAHMLLPSFDGAVRFIDLGPISDPQLVPCTLASELGLMVRNSDPTPSIVSFLRDKRMLLMLDSCEHVIETAAAFAERIFEEAPQVYILATSREPLWVEGEHVHRLAALDSPPDAAGLTAAEALAFPAIQLFVERVIACGNRYELSDADAPVVAEICRRLDGIALAIELAASRVGAYGVKETAALLEHRFGLLWQGRRTALPRHQTLSATLEWSYDLLTEQERVILRRLAVFAGAFTLEACLSVAAGDDVDEAQIVGAVGSLVARSLATAAIGPGETYYRLLDTTRAYVLEKLIDSGEADAASRRHAAYYRDYLERIGAGLRGGGTQSLERATCAIHVGNVRKALEWCFGPGGDVALGVGLAAASAPLLLKMSLLTQCHRWTARALASLDQGARGTRRELELRSAFGLALMFTKGNSEEVRVAFTRALVLAEAFKDPVSQLRLLGRLHIFHERIGDFRGALACAERGAAVAGEIADPAGMAAAQSLLGIGYHLNGDQARARAHLEAALIQPPCSQRINSSDFGFDHSNRARITLARTLWLQGHADQALALARQTVEEAAALEHPVTLCIALICAVSVCVWRGDIESADEGLDRFMAHAERHSLAPYNAVGQGVKGKLAVMRGQAESGMKLLRDALETLHAARYELVTASFKSSIANGLAMTGNHAAALKEIDETLDLAECGGGDSYFMPELLRLKGRILMACPRAQSAKAEGYLRRALELSRRQGALAWELRAATSLAAFWAAQDAVKQAREVLAPVYARLTEGFDSADVKYAGRLLDQLGMPAHSNGALSGTEPRPAQLRSA
ncbi:MULTISPECIES: winged helix-turn-helix domain-containing protein [Rhodomicrobium]|uniref:ATP-binding protein n=1 Tax=Rhodomicrobium TaxID=1068 RepID=UPI000B4BD052|nr:MULTISPECIES: winged helix-turn-helix domain-containing protein [Rhodomicrobium]